MRRAWALVGLVVLLAAGCLGLGSEGTAQPEDPPAGPTEGAPGPGVVGEASLEVPVLGLATFSGIPSEQVEPFVPADMEPTSCFGNRSEDRVQVVVIATEERYPDLPGDHGEASTQHLTVASCAQRPNGMAREASNEPPWVSLLNWAEGAEYRAFLDEGGVSRPQGNVSLTETSTGYDVHVEADGGLVLEASFVTSGLGIPTAEPFDCEPAEMVGRVIYEPTDGGLAALDWNKTEAICMAEATVDWPESSPIAEILGPERAPDFVIDTRVQEAEYVWRGLGEP